MLWKVFRMIFESQPVSFSADGSPEEAAERLSGRVKTSVFRTYLSEAVVGKVSVDKVFLYRHQPTFRNSFRPVFTGRFVLSEGTTVLTGEFTTHPSVRVFVSIWFCAVFFFGASSLMDGIGESFGKGMSVWVGIVSVLGECAIPLVMGVVGYVLVRFSKRYSKDDVAYISNAVREAIGGNSD